jgi:hypothetical protein
MGLRQRRGLAAALAALVTTLLTSSTSALAAGAPSVWIDQPLPGATLPFSATAVVIHAADPGGIASVRLLVDGVAVGSVSAPPGDLVTVSWTWAPAGPGLHLLTAVAEGAGGTPSDPQSVAVTFAAPAESTPTPGPSPTATACTPPLPTVLNPPDFFLATATSDPPTNPPTFRWAYRTAPSCAPGGFRVTVVQSPSGDYSVKSGKLSPTTDTWTPPEALPAGATCGSAISYTWTFRVLRSDGTVAQTVTRTMVACTT